MQENENNSNNNNYAAFAVCTQNNNELMFINIDAMMASQVVLKSTAQENGTPLITNYSPDLFNAEPQIWAVIQDKRGLMYFG